MPESLLDKPLVWLHGEVKSPPLSLGGRLKAGVLLRRLQRGEPLGLPESRPLPVVGPRCHELRVVDRGSSWRVVYRVDVDAVVIAEVFRKTTRKTPEWASKRAGEGWLNTTNGPEGEGDSHGRSEEA